MHIRVSNPDGLSWIYKVKSKDGSWIMTAPLKTIRDIYDLHNLAINRIISAEHNQIDLFNVKTYGEIYLNRVVKEDAV